jgi:hypothetical protein
MGLCFQLFPDNMSEVEVVEFLRNLFRVLSGKVDLLWDRGPIHKRILVRDYLRKQRRVQTHWFPAYAPELNPDEFIWTRSKQRLAIPVLTNTTCWETKSMTPCGASLARKAFCAPASTNPISLVTCNILSIIYARINKRDFGLEMTRRKCMRLTLE